MFAVLFHLALILIYSYGAMLALGRIIGIRWELDLAKQALLNALVVIPPKGREFHSCGLPLEVKHFRKNLTI